MSHSTMWRLGQVGAAAVLGALAGAAVVQAGGAAGRVATAEITACTDARHYLYLPPCRAGDSTISWNKDGLQGPAGRLDLRGCREPPGPVGRRGLPARRGLAGPAQATSLKPGSIHAYPAGKFIDKAGAYVLYKFCPHGWRATGGGAQLVGGNGFEGHLLRSQYHGPDNPGQPDGWSAVGVVTKIGTDPGAAGAGHPAELDLAVICVKTSLPPPPPNQIAKPAGLIGGAK